MTEQIRGDLLKGTFGKYPHDFYLTYDELSDELIVRVIDPKRPAYIQELQGNDEFALLVEVETDEVIGFQLFNFEKTHLQKPTWSNLRTIWDQVKSAYRRMGFRKFHYDPSLIQRVNTAPPVTSKSFYFQSAEILQQELVKSPA